MSNKMYRKVVIIGCLVVGLLGVSVFSMGKRPPTNNIQQKVAAIDFTLKDLAGKPHKLSDYRGKIVFLNFWATWCPPCRAEMPSMQKMYSAWDKDKYVMLAVDVRERKSSVLAFSRKYKYTFPILLDLDGSIAKKYFVRGIPTTYIIDEKGNIVAHHVGSREWMLSDFEALLK